MKSSSIVAKTPGAEYRIVSRWTFEATREETAEISLDPEAMSDWWPAAFLHVALTRPGGLFDAAQSAAIQAKGWMPYTVRFQARVSEADYPRSITVAVEGDFEGRCVIRLSEHGPFVELEFDWWIDVKKPLVRLLSPVLKPLFVSNHVWVMRRGRESIELELIRRRARRNGANIEIPPPPGPTFAFLLDRAAKRTAS